MAYETLKDLDDKDLQELAERAFVEVIDAGRQAGYARCAAELAEARMKRAEEYGAAIYEEISRRRRVGE